MLFRGYKIDMFSDGAFDEFVNNNGYIYNTVGSETTITGRTKFGFQTNRFKLALKFMYEGKYKLDDCDVTLFDDRVVIKNKQNSGFNSWV